MNRRSLILLSMLTLFFLNCGANEYSHKEYSLIMLQQIMDTRSIVNVNTNERVKLDELYVNIFTRVGIFTTDSILIYNYLNISPDKNPTIYPLIVSLAKTSDTHRYILYFFQENLISENQIKDSLEIVFEEGNFVKVGLDRYSLNKTYYNQLKNSALAKKDILDIIGLLKDTPGDYKEYISQIVENLWVFKENTDKRIFNAIIHTQSPQSDCIYEWQTSYDYDQSGHLTGVKMQNTEKGIYYEKKYIRSNAQAQVSYQYLNNDVSVFCDSVYRNSIHLLDSILCTHTHIGLNMEQQYIVYPIIRKQYKVKKLEMSNKDVIDLIKDDLLYFIKSASEGLKPD